MNSRRSLSLVAFYCGRSMAVCGVSLIGGTAEKILTMFTNLAMFMVS